MTSEFEIWVDRLKGGQVQKIKGFFDPAFFEIEEKELTFPTPVEVHGEAYLSEGHLILRIKGKARAKMPCAICNEMSETEMVVADFYHAEPIEAIVSGIFSFKEPLREAFLIELPRTIECNEGNCPERALLGSFMSPKVRTKNPTYFPFSDLKGE